MISTVQHEPFRSVICATVLLVCVLALAEGDLSFPSSSNLLQLKDHRKLHAEFWLKAAAKQISGSATANSPACSADYGEQYIRRWTNLQGTFCNRSTSPSNPSHSSSSSSSSSVTCHAHPEADISTCAATNLVLSNTADFLGNKQGIAGLPDPRQGSIWLACSRTADPKTFLRGRLQSNEGSRLWLVQAPVFSNSAGISQGHQQHLHETACKRDGTVQHPVLFVMRVDPENAFHNLENVVSVFAALAAMQLPHELFYGGMEVVIADDRLPGYFLDVWRRLSHPHPLRILRQQPFPPGTCFSTALLAPYTAHTQSLLTYKAGTADEVLCESVVLHAVSLWLRHLFRDLLPVGPGAVSSSNSAGITSSEEQNAIGSSSSSVSAARISSSSSSSSWRTGWQYSEPAAAADLALLQPTPTQSALQMQQLHVLWLSRVRFEKQHEQELTGWQRARQLPPQLQEQLLVELQRAVLQWNDRTCVPDQKAGCVKRNVMFSLQVAELSDLSFYPDQISLFMRTGVLLGVHGAGLANQVFMAPGRGAVIELWYSMENNFHYHNMAHMLGHKYYNVRADDKLDFLKNVPQLVNLTVAAMDAVAAGHAAAAAAAASRRTWWRRGWSGR